MSIYFLKKKKYCQCHHKEFKHPSSSLDPDSKTLGEGWERAGGVDVGDVLAARVRRERVWWVGQLPEGKDAAPHTAMQRTEKSGRVQGQGWRQGFWSKSSTGIVKELNRLPI